MIRAKRATSRTFVVRFPWNACYCGRLRWALERLGLATMKDPFEDGSDNAALFVATGSRTLAGRTMIRAYGAELEAGASFDDVEARLAASPGRRARDHPRLEMAGLGGRCVDAAAARRGLAAARRNDRPERSSAATGSICRCGARTLPPARREC